MKYLCIIYAREAGEPLSAADEIAIKDACIEQDQQLFENGQLVLASPLQPPETSVVVRYRDGQVVHSDGPFAETKEWIAGFMVIDALDMAEAIKLATEGPLEGLVDMEIRPLLKEKHSRTGMDRSFFFR